MNKTPDSEQLALRKRAVAQLTNLLEPELDSYTYRKLLHELRVHQVELELQNEELRRIQLALAESHDRYVDLYDFAPVAYLTLDGYGLIKEVNLTGAVFLGEKRPNLLQQNFSRFVSQTDKDRWHLFFWKLLKPSSQPEKQTLDLYIKSPANAMLCVQLNCVPMLDTDSQRPLLRIALTDISERRRAESVLIEARQLAETASRAKSDFISCMNHEMRTPMNAVLGFAQLLDDDDLTEDQHDSVKEILTAGQHLMELINEVLDLSKIESHKLELTLESIDLSVVVQNCITMMQALVFKNRIQIINHIVAADNFMVTANSLRFKQVLLNLISNAIKYNRSGGSVMLFCEAADSQNLRINVTDTGNGLSESQLAKLFLPFERLSAQNSNIEGTGIGLVIAKKLIEAMGGAIGVSSKVGEGSCFWIEIPLAFN